MKIPIHGWCLPAHNDPPQYARIYVEKELIAETDFTIERRDVEKSYPEYECGKKVGFFIEIEPIKKTGIRIYNKGGK